MVEVIPFNGLIYNKAKIKDIENVMSPPYDIISDEMQEKLYKKHPYNFVRLILGKQFPDDTDNHNRYTRAKDFFDSWIKDSIFIQYDKPAIFAYKISYKIKNQTKTMNGFFTLLKLDADYKTVKAHEKTLSKPKADRLNLMRECYANLEPIQLLYIDEEDKIREKIDNSLNAPIFDIKGYDGFNHKIWKIDDEKIISFVQNQLKNKILFIADGHHRYQTAINYANELKEKKKITDGNAPFNYRMVILANLFDEGLAILPTHRLIKKSDIDINKTIDNLKDLFYVEEKITKNQKDVAKKIKKNLETLKDHKFALYTKGRYFVLTLKDDNIMEKYAIDKSKVWRTLDVSILHKIILESFMGISQENIEDYVKYTRMDEEAIQLVDEGKFGYSFFMNPTKIEELKSVAEAGEHMPQKSTYFLPKMLSGLVIYKM
jgi:uncharacterized protein (DUF1015 family)